MSSKRRSYGDYDRDQGRAHPAKRQKKGFSVGPANLPEGSWKRKVDKIKQDLIHKAKLRKQYAKVRQRELADHSAVRYDEQPDEDEQAQNDTNNDTQHVPNSQSNPEPFEPHPDRQQLMKQPSPPPRYPINHEEDDEDATQSTFRHRQRRPKHQPFAHEAAQAQKRKDEAEARRKAREEAEAERQRKLADRERFRTAMAKARRTGPSGKRKLGREGPVLLEKVRRMVSDG